MTGSISDGTQIDRSTTVPSYLIGKAELVSRRAAGAPQRPRPPPSTALAAAPIPALARGHEPARPEGWSAIAISIEGRGGMARLLSHLGRAGARHRVLAVLTWVLVLVAFAAVALSGMKFSDGGFDVPGTPSSKAMTVLEEEFPSTDDDAGTLQLVVTTGEAGAITDPGATSEVTSARDELAAIPGVRSVSDPFDAQQPYVSADLTTAVMSIEVDPGADPDQVTDVADELDDQGLTAEVGGSLEDAVPEILGPTEVIGAVIAFVVLLITYGSLVAAGANMLGALVGVGVGILGVLGFSAITPIGSLTPILAVMLGLAVGIDYCLFILARFRAELRTGESVEDAVARAVGTAGCAVVFAGATVIIALVGLTVVGIPFLGEMGLAAAFAVAVVVLMALTLLPAMLATMGRRALSRADRAQPAASQQEDSRVITGWAGFVTRHRRTAPRRSFAPTAAPSTYSPPCHLTPGPPGWSPARGDSPVRGRRCQGRGRPRLHVASSPAGQAADTRYRTVLFGCLVRAREVCPVSYASPETSATIPALSGPAERRPERSDSSGHSEARSSAGMGCAALDRSGRRSRGRGVRAGARRRP